MTIIASALSGTPEHNIPPSAAVFSTKTNTTVERRVGTIEQALLAAKDIAVQLAVGEASFGEPILVRYEQDGVHLRDELIDIDAAPREVQFNGESVDIDITPVEVDLTEEEEAVVEAKELTTDLVAVVLAEESEDAIVAQHDEVEPSKELALPTVVIAQDGDRVEIAVDSEYPFTMWRSIGGRTGTKAIPAGESTHSYKGSVDEAELRLDDENGPSLI